MNQFDNNNDEWQSYLDEFDDQDEARFFWDQDKALGWKFRPENGEITYCKYCYETHGHWILAVDVNVDGVWLCRKCDHVGFPERH